MEQLSFYLLASLIALAAVAVFIVISKLWILLARQLQRVPTEARKLLNEPGNHSREQLHALNTNLAIHLSSLAMFFIVLTMLHFLQAAQIQQAYSLGTNIILATFVLIGALYLIIRVVKLKIEQLQTRKYLYIEISVGQSLNRVLQKGFFVFHDIRSGDVVIDHVVLGPSGVYCVYVVAHPHKKGEEDLPAHFDGNRINFPDGIDNQAVIRSRANRQWFNDLLSEATGSSIKTRSVIVVPGWNVKSDSSKEFLVVKPSSLPMLTEWTRKDAFLMKEEIGKVYRQLTQLCTKH